MYPVLKIIEHLDNYLSKSGQISIGPVEANAILAKTGLLHDSRKRAGKPLRILLRKGLLPHAYQLGGKGSDWTIPHSSKRKSIVSNYYPIRTGRKVIKGGSDVRFGALILLDGYELEDAGIGFVLNTPMNAIDRIDILNATPLYGMRGANGVINIITKVGLRREPVTLAPNSVYTSFQGFEVPRIFYSPKYDNKTEQTAAPDYRSTIFWEPEINQNNDKKEVDFFNSDRPTNVNITVEGVTEKGIPLSCKTNYVVK